MSRRDYTIEAVDSDKQSRREWTRDVARGDLCIGEIRRHAKSARKQRRINCGRRECRHTIEPTRIRERLDHATIGSAENRHVTNEPESKLIVEETVVPAYHTSRCCRPPDTPARRNISLRHTLP